MENIRLKPSAYEVFQKVKADLCRYETVVNYFIRNPIRLNKQNRQYLNEVYFKLIGLGDKFFQNSFLITKIQSLETNLSRAITFGPSLSRCGDALEPLFDPQNDFIRASEKEKLKPIGAQ